MRRLVFVRADDHCFVEVPRATEVVDCPMPHPTPCPASAKAK